MKIELARTGLADNGQWVFSTDLQEIVATFAEQGEAPITLGHAKSDRAPAFGRVKSVELDDNGLVLSGDVEFHPALKDAFDQGLYTKWSIGAPKRPSDGKRYLHHVAMLGAVPPAIKGLRTLSELGVVELADRDGTEFEFSTASNPTDPTDTTMAKDPGSNPPPQQQPDQQPPIQAADKPNAEVERLQQQVASMQEDLRKSQLQALRKVGEGRLPEPALNQLVELADQVAQGMPADTLELSDKDGNKSKSRVIDAIAAIVAQIPQPVQPGALELGDPGTGSSADDDKVKTGDWATKL
jgi:HAMP domain-containing protein